MDSRKGANLAEAIRPQGFALWLNETAFCEMNALQSFAQQGLAPKSRLLEKIDYIVLVRFF